MGLERCVLLVSHTMMLGEALARVIRRAGHRLVVARSFQAAKEQLERPPDVLITELKLGAYNGLQLALRSRTAGIPAIVVADESFEREVEQLGAIWMSPQLAASEELPNMITRSFDAAPAQDTSGWYNPPADNPTFSSPLHLLGGVSPVLH